MSLPQNMQPEPAATEPVVTETPAPEATTSSEPAVDAAVTEDPATAAEDATDAQLRTWAKDNGIEGVPTSGRLSVAWRDQITAAMAAALDPKEEASVESTSSPESSTSTETMTEEKTDTGVSGEETSPPTEEPVAVQPEFETGQYRSVFKAPNTFVSSQTFTA